MRDVTKTKLSFKQVMLLANWIEDYRDPDKQPQYVVIEVEHTAIGPAITAYIDTKEGEGVWKDFTDHDTW